MDAPTLLSSNDNFLGRLSDIAEPGTIVDQQALLAGGNAHPSQGGFIASSDGHTSASILPDVPPRNDTHNRAYIYSPHQNSQRILLSGLQPPVTSYPTSYSNPAFIPPSFQNQQHQHASQQQHFEVILQVPFQQYSLPTARTFHPFQNAYPIPSFPVHYSQPQLQTQLNPPQYVSLFTHTHYLPLPASPPLSVPSVAHIPLLTNKFDFFTWDDVVTSLLRASRLIGHILDLSEPLDQSRPDRKPSILPVLPLSPTAGDFAALKRWWDEDNVAQHILTSRIGAVPRGLLLSPNLATRTELTIYQVLKRYYGTSIADCAELLHTLNSTPCVPGCIQEYGVPAFLVYNQLGFHLASSPASVSSFAVFHLFPLTILYVPIYHNE